MLVGDVPQLQATLITIPYKYQCFKFNLLLPKNITGLENLLSASTFLKGLHQVERFVQLDMPTFEAATTLTLNDDLKMV